MVDIGPDQHIRMQVVIPVDPADKEDVAFWEAHNPDILAMASSAKVGLLISAQLILASHVYIHF